MATRETHQETLAITLCSAIVKDTALQRAPAQTIEMQVIKFVFFPKQEHEKHLLRMISFHLSNIRMTSTKRHVYVEIYRCNRSMNVFASARPEPSEHDKKRELLVKFFQGFCFSKVFDTGRYIVFRDW